jgi:RNA polymerase sigma-54 factor
MAGVELKQQLKLSQTLVLTPQLQLAIKLLQLPRLELIEIIRQELETNPVLDDIQGTQEDDEAQVVPLEEVTAAGGGLEPTGNLSETEVRGGKEVDWERYLENSSLSPVIPVYKRAPDDEMPGVETAPSREENLFEYLIWQVRLSGFTPEEEKLAALIIGNLDEFGYFREVLPGKDAGQPQVEDFENIAVSAAENAAAKEGTASDEDAPGAPPAPQEAAGGAEGAQSDSTPAPPEEPREEYMSLDRLALEVGITFDQAEVVLKKIQHLDPLGVAARTLEECLLVQAEVYGLGDSVKEIIRGHLKNLQKRNFNAIAKDLKITVEEVMEAAKKISNLDPKPARNFTGDPPQYIVPDVYVEKIGSDFVVKINDDGMPKLKISDSYRKHISDPRAKEYIKGKLRNAHWLIRSIEQRRKTIIRVTECIVEKQLDFMEKGPAYLKPMVLHDVARALDLHESTISRVTSGKYVHTPQGIFELKYFFNTGIHTTGHEETSSEAVKNKIKDIITGEDPSVPLSDQQIVTILAKEGIMIARRTVAKYRDMLGILPSSQRKHVLF